MQKIEELKRQGLSVTAIAGVTGIDRKTIRKYLAEPNLLPRYRPRAKRASLLAAFESYLGQRMAAGVWNAVVLLRELRERGYRGGYTILKDYLQPKREEAGAVAVRRFETPPGKQAQVDWGHLGTIEIDGVKRKLSGFTLTLGYSRMMMAQAALSEKLGTVLRMHEEAFRQLGGVPEEILYDRMRTVWMDIDDRGEIVWNPVFLDFARYWGFTPRLAGRIEPRPRAKWNRASNTFDETFFADCLGENQRASTNSTPSYELGSGLWPILESTAPRTISQPHAGQSSASS